MAQRSETVETSASKVIRFFHCDGLYDLHIIDELYRNIEPEVKAKFNIIHHVFNLHEMGSFSEKIASMDMNHAVFVVHANESRLSINEKGAGIGYAKVYTALQERTGDKVLVVIGGDDHYRGEEDRAVLSDWAKYKISSQFSPEYMDGRKSFIFSWDHIPNPIHYLALKHFIRKKEHIFKLPSGHPQKGRQDEIHEITGKEEVFSTIPSHRTEEDNFHHIKSACGMMDSYLEVPELARIHALLEYGEMKCMFYGGDKRKIPENILRDTKKLNQSNHLTMITILENIGQSYSVEYHNNIKTETVFQDSYWYYYPSLLAGIYPIEPSGDVITTLLLTSGKIIGRNDGKINANLEADLREYYKGCPFVFLEVYRDPYYGFNTKAYSVQESILFKFMESLTWYSRGLLQMLPTPYDKTIHFPQ